MYQCYTLKSLADIFINKVNESMSLIRSVIPKYQLKVINSKGIQCISVFRGEYDYSFIIPWEYCEDVEKIKDFYKRLEDFTKYSGTITEQDNLCDLFTILEFKTLRE